MEVLSFRNPLIEFSCRWFLTLINYSLIHRLETNMAEVRNFGCCFDNFKASKFINIAFLVIEGIMVIIGLIPLLQVLLWVRIKKYLRVSILYFHSRLRLRFEGFLWYRTWQWFECGHWRNCSHHLYDLYDHWRFVACWIHQAKQSCIDGWVNLEWHCHPWIGSPNAHVRGNCVCDTFHAPHHCTQIVDFFDWSSMLSLYCKSSCCLKNLILIDPFWYLCSKNE